MEDHDATTAPSRAVRALLFDLGGVVVQIDFGRVFAAWAASAGCDPADIADRFTYDGDHHRYERGEISASEYFAAVRAALGVDLSEEDLAAGWNEIFVGPVPGIGPLLTAAARQWPLYLFSNSNPTHREVWAVRFAEELSSFRAVFVSSDIGARKPDLESFAAVVAEIGFEPAEILFFDDTADNVDGARRAGMQAVLVRSARDVAETLEGLGLRAEHSGPG